jgi:DNA mismatch endonuclease (patch repair protein)
MNVQKANLFTYYCSMSDNHTPEQRSHNMSRIRSADTRPERIVRSMIHRMGYRYALHCRQLPGKPDIVLTSRRKIVFVHGCFWHAHKCRWGDVRPKTNSQYWREKISSNAERDKKHLKALQLAGWRILVVWECQVRSPSKLTGRLSRFLSEGGGFTNS